MMTWTTTETIVQRDKGDPVVVLRGTDKWTGAEGMWLVCAMSVRTSTSDEPDACEVSHEVSIKGYKLTKAGKLPKRREYSVSIWGPVETVEGIDPGER